MKPDEAKRVKSLIKRRYEAGFFTPDSIYAEIDLMVTEPTATKPDILCPECKKLLHWNAHFQAYLCVYPCGYDSREPVDPDEPKLSDSDIKTLLEAVGDDKTKEDPRDYQ